MIIWNILGLIAGLLAVPFLIGLLPVQLIEKEKRNLGTVMVAGYILTFALFELVCVPVVMLCNYSGFTILTISFSTVLGMGSLLGIIFCRRMIKQGRWTPLFQKGRFKSLIKEMTWEERIMWILFLLILGFQMYMAFARASFDGDDAYFIGQSLAAQTNDTMYRVSPYTGRSTPLDMRHALAVFPMWVAYVGRISGIHATIIAHSVLPLVLIPLTYLLYGLIGARILKDKKDMVPMFLILISLFNIFGNVSIYTQETFFLTRTWQGKSVAGNFIIPGVIWVFLAIFDGEKERHAKNTGLWLLLAMVNLSAGISSSLAVLLCAGLTALCALLMSLYTRKFNVLVKAGLTCIPSGIYVLLYLFLR